MLAFTDKAMCANCETVLSAEPSSVTANDDEMQNNFVSSQPVSDFPAESFSSPEKAEVVQHQANNTDTPRPPRTAATVYSAFKLYDV